MSARNEEKDTLIASGSFRGHSKIKIQSVASSAGGTAMMAIVAQPHRGHLNGNVNDEFDIEECYARATVAGTRAQSLTVIVSPIDMQGMIGMMQVLAGRAHPIYEEYRGDTTWRLPQLEGQQDQQSKAEVQSWRISHAGTWAEQTLPPLAIGFNLRRAADGQDRDVFLRLRLVLVRASNIPNAQSHLQVLKRIAHDAFDIRHRWTTNHWPTVVGVCHRQTASDGMVGTSVQLFLRPLCPWDSTLEVWRSYAHCPASRHPFFWRMENSSQPAAWPTDGSSTALNGQGGTRLLRFNRTHTHPGEHMPKYRSVYHGL